jgi:Flp pilus assembly protein TadG
MMHTSRRSLISRLREDDGVSAILVCLVVAFLVIPVAAVSVDLSNAYSNRRQMQNAADAASQAGAQIMAAVQQGAQPASKLATVVTDIAAKNGSDTSGNYSCNVAKVTYDPLAVAAGPSCETWNGDSSYNAVTVHTTHTVGTFFAGAIASVSSTSTSAGATATATIQKVIDPDMGNSIFAMCAYDVAGNGNGNGAAVDPSWVPLLVDAGAGLELNTGQLADAATPTPSAVGHRYVIWSNGGGNSNLSRCGLGSSSFDGLICGLAVPTCGQPITLPNWLAINTGAQVGPTLATVAGYPTCQSSTFSNLNGPTTFQPCAMVMPICDQSNSLTGSNGEIHCVTFGEFYVSPGAQDANDDSCTFVTGSSTTICARFVGPPDLPNGKPDSDPPGAGDAYRVALVQ